MATLFELVVNYGQAVEAAEAAGRAAAALPPLAAGRHRVGLHEPSIHFVLDDADGYVELSIAPVAVGWGNALDHGLPRLHLTDAELSELGRGLYALLATFTGYRAARVGWDPEGFVDLAELREDWTDELAAGALPGLVLADDVVAGLGAVNGLVPFAPGYRWLPYEGDRQLQERVPSVPPNEGP